MADDLHQRDVVLWSEREADLLRRVAAGERVNDVDWDNIIDEVASLGASELRACTSLLRQGMLHLCKLAAWPDHAASQHWREETPIFLADAALAFTPSMRQRLEVAPIHRWALMRVRQIEHYGPPQAALRPEVAITLDDLLADTPELDRMIAALRATP